LNQDGQDESRILGLLSPGFNAIPTILPSSGKSGFKPPNKKKPPDIEIRCQKAFLQMTAFGSPAVMVLGR
jgi:hypothetical protein